MSDFDKTTQGEDDAPPAEQEYMPAEFLDADPELIPGDQTPPAKAAGSEQPGRDRPLQKAPVPPAVERIERKTSTLDNWEGEGGATLTGPVPEKMPENPDDNGTR